MATRKKRSTSCAAPEVGYPLHLQRQPADADLGRGGPVVWLSEADAKDLGIPITTGLKSSTATVL